MHKKMKDQVNEMIYQYFWGYVNGIIDDDYELLTRQGWIDYMLMCLRMDAERGQMVNGLEFKHLYFAGKETIIKEINKFLNQDEAQKYILK
jgi:hypothetical protein